MPAARGVLFARPSSRLTCARFCVRQGRGQPRVLGSALFPIIKAGVGDHGDVSLPLEPEGTLHIRLRITGEVRDEDANNETEA